jgi:hypothetical protein
MSSRGSLHLVSFAQGMGASPHGLAGSLLAMSGLHFLLRMSICDPGEFQGKQPEQASLQLAARADLSIAGSVDSASRAGGSNGARCTGPREQDTLVPRRNGEAMLQRDRQSLDSAATSDA